MRRLCLEIVFVVLRLSSGKGVLRLTVLSVCCGIYIVCVRKFCIRICGGGLQSRLGIDRCLITGIRRIERSELVLGRPTSLEHRGTGSKGGVLVDMVKVVLERLVLCKLVLGLFDIRLGILYRLFCRIERALRVRRSVLGGRELGLGILYGVFGSNKTAKLLIGQI